MRIRFPRQLQLIARQLGLVASDPTSRGFGVILGASVTRLGLGFVASVIVARSLGPGALGVYALLGVVANLAAAVGDPGLTASGIRRLAMTDPVDLIRLPGRAGVFLLSRLVVVVAVCLAAALLIVPEPQLVGGSVTGSLLALALAGVVASALSGGMNSILQATSRFDRLALALLVNPILTVVIAVLLAQSGGLNLVTALIGLGIVPSLVASFVAFGLVPFSIEWRVTSRELFLAESRSLFQFGRWIWVSDLLAALAAQLDLLLLGWLQIGVGSIGRYSLALNLSSKADVVNQSLYTVSQTAASALRSDGGIRRSLTRGLVRSLALMSGLVVLYLLTPFLIETLYGPVYALAAPLLRGLLAAAAVDLLTTPALLLAYHFDRPRILALADATRVIVIVVVAVALVPSIGVFGLVIARIASRILGAGAGLLTLRLTSREQSVDLAA